MAVKTELSTARLAMTREKAILERLSDGRFYAIHELGIIGYSDNTLATGMSILHQRGAVRGRRRKEKAYKEWRLSTPEEIALFLRNKMNGVDNMPPPSKKCPHCYGTGRVAA